MDLRSLTREEARPISSRAKKGWIASAYIICKKCGRSWRARIGRGKGWIRPSATGDRLDCLNVDCDNEGMLPD
jgi:hypothetical protein